VERTSGCTFSTPDRIATRGTAMPSAWATSTAFRMIWIFSFRSGATLTPPSEVITIFRTPSRRSSKRATSLMRRPVRSDRGPLRTA
jgi:hypothetical protein